MKTVSRALDMLFKDELEYNTKMKFRTANANRTPWK
ncbi:hypothetical protein T4A_9266 [Trichinella pseudospiralis]|uniref:Uncharacterized protein n=1 Tax=Trichinella pseudospiralis TaxID=6337 RepID=A0A0V1DS84_TRIPS|nr:hypothetical protein T4A_9266 [Trichinella pseudospiralis]